MQTKTTIDINSRLEMFVDDYLIESMRGVNYKLHTPQIASNNPPCSESLSYETVIKEHGIYHRYGRSAPSGIYDGNPAEKTLHFISKDGITWSEPEVVLEKDEPRSHNFSPFLDTSPNALPEEKFKALAGTHKDDRGRARQNGPILKDEDSGLFAYASPDGIRWEKMSDKKVLSSEQFAFDSQNVSFWSIAEQCYVCYFRTWKDHEEFSPEAIARADYQDFVKYHLRSISRTTSHDFINWSNPVTMNPNLPGEDLYTSLTHPYFRAPHIYIALPTRFMRDRGSSTDILFMSSRAGSTSYCRLFTEAFIRPGLDPARWGNRSNYVSLNVVPTSDTEISIYHKCGYRYTLRTDGFISINTGYNEGELVTKPFIFSGNKLIVNYSTSAAGCLKVEILNPDNTPIPGFTLSDCQANIGDAIEKIVNWQGEPNLQALSGKPIKLRIVMSECDLYSFRFKSQKNLTNII